jgi:alkylhydroperoxidase/carboxymuconolactone decarboxylase family protein YurZ
MDENGPNPMEILERISPAGARTCMEHRAALMDNQEPAALRAKVKLLVGIGVASALQSERCTLMGTKRARAAGVSGAEIVEAIPTARRRAALRPSAAYGDNSDPITPGIGRFDLSAHTADNSPRTPAPPLLHPTCHEYPPRTRQGSSSTRVPSEFSSPSDARSRVLITPTPPTSSGSRVWSPFRSRDSGPTETRAGGGPRSATRGASPHPIPRIPPLEAGVVFR